MFFVFFKKKSLKAKNESHHRSIIGLTTEKEDVRLRIRALLNKRIAAQGPDFDEYKINRKTSRTYEPIEAKTRKRSTSGRKSVTSTAKIDVDSQPALPASVTFTVQAN